MIRNNYDGYETLGNAIILQAVKDYRQALKRVRKNSRNQESVRVKDEVERFFRSGWFGQLTGIDCEMLIRKLNTEVAE